MNNSNINVGVYIRLSESDKNKMFYDESQSVQNQRMLIMDYIKEHNMNFIKEYVDDGYSGLNFNRPGFIEMMNDIEDKKIDTIIVKDLSRFGRDHVMTGYYVENYFPSINIRFISVGDGLDSFNLKNSNDSFTFIIACNDYYSRHYSLKIRDMLRQKQRQGKYTGSNAPYGYIKDPDDRGHLIPDPKTAPIVKQIFGLALNEYSNSAIVEHLNQNKIVSPGHYSNPKKFQNEKWNVSSIKKILSNPIYTGDLIQHTSERINYKTIKKVEVPKKDWIKVENTHEALVSKADFEYLKKYPASCRAKKNSRLLDSLLYCSICGEDLYINPNSKSCYCRNCNEMFFKYEKLEEKIFSVLCNNKLVLHKNFTRRMLFDLIDKIFADKTKKFTIVFNDDKKEIINFQYDF